MSGPNVCVTTAAKLFEELVCARETRCSLQIEQSAAIGDGHVRLNASRERVTRLSICTSRFLCSRRHLSRGSGSGLAARTVRVSHAFTNDGRSRWPKRAGNDRAQSVHDQWGNGIWYDGPRRVRMPSAPPAGVSKKWTMSVGRRKLINRVRQRRSLAADLVIRAISVVRLRVERVVRMPRKAATHRYVRHP